MNPSECNRPSSCQTFVKPHLAASMGSSGFIILVIAFVVQYTGLLAERWFFFAQANHPQNLYYQTVG